MWEKNYTTAGPASGYLGGGTVAASKPGTSPESMTGAFDQSLDTKWFASGTQTPWLSYRFAGTTTRVVTSYNIASANDVPQRDPRSWVLEGSNNGSTWTALNTQTNQTFATRKLLKSYTVASSAGYNQYRLRVTANNGSADFQLSEVQLFGY